MKKAIKVTNKFISTIWAFSSINSSSESGSFVLSDVVVDGYSLPWSNTADVEWQKWIYFLLVDYGTITEEWFRIYRTDLTTKTVYFDKRWGPNWKQLHYSNATVQLNDVAEAVNYMSSNIDTFGLVEYITGSSPQAVKVSGGYPMYNLIWMTSVVNVADTNFVVGVNLPDNAINYIVFDFNSGLFAAKTAADLSGQTFYWSVIASVVTAWWAISTIVDYRWSAMWLAVDKNTFQFTSGALTIKDNSLSASKLTSSWATSWQFLMWNGSAWVPSNGMAASSSALKTSWADVNVWSSAPPTTGMVLVATSATTATWQNQSINTENVTNESQVNPSTDYVLIHDTSENAMNKTLISDLLDLRFWKWSDWDVTISTSVTLVRDMHYNNLTIASWWILNPNWYKIFCTWVFMLQSWWIIRRNWNNGWDWWYNTPWTGWAALNSWTINWETWPAWAGWTWNAWWWNWINANPSYQTATAANWWQWYPWWTWWTSTQWNLYNIMPKSLDVFIWLMYQPFWFTTNSTTYKSSWTAWWWAWSQQWSWNYRWWGGGWGNGWVVFICARQIIIQWLIELKWWNWWLAWGSTWGMAASWWGWWSWWTLITASKSYNNTGTITLTWWAWGWANWWSWPWSNWATWLHINITLYE